MARHVGLLDVLVQSAQIVLVVERERAQPTWHVGAEAPVRIAFEVIFEEVLRFHTDAARPFGLLGGGRRVGVAGVGT